MNGSTGRLYGIEHSNRTGSDLWGKNQFNSTFPTAICCYMRDHGIPPVYLCVGEGGDFQNIEISFNEIWGTERPNEEIFFAFESRFSRFEEVLNGSIERVDLVVSNLRIDESGVLQEGAQLQPLEVKLTVVPDEATHSLAEDQWGAEIVFRPATTKYCAMSMAFHCRAERDVIREIFEQSLSGVRDWGNEIEAKAILPAAIACLERFRETLYRHQAPLVMQPIWKTEGKSPVLAENAFDVFIWSDFGLLTLIIDQARSSILARDIKRPARSALRIARFLFEYGRAGNGHIANIYDQMTYGKQSDKCFSVNGHVTRRYMKHPRIISPAIKREAVNEIILDGGENFLSPERRFDQSIYFLARY